VAGREVRVATWSGWGGASGREERGELEKEGWGREFNCGGTVGGATGR
jgi:hypothetical protein